MKKLTSKQHEEAFSLFMQKQFENENLTTDPDDYPDAYAEWKEAMSDDDHNALVDKFSDFINSK